MVTEGPATFTFTKLVVDDLDAMADYYCSVFGLHRGRRERFEDGVAGETIEEIALVGRPGEVFGAISLFTFIGRIPARDDEVILGFTTPDLSALLDRVKSGGGRRVGPVKEMPDHGIRVAFVRDPEGHMAELVELVGEGR